MLYTFDYGENDRVRPPHLCSPSCGDPCETYREIRVLESKIVEMKQSLESTLHVYLGLRTKMNVLHDPFLCRVPLEVATTIFRFCLPIDRNPIHSPYVFNKDKDEEYNARVLFNLGAVCRSWRQIIWSTPHFWSHLSICIKPATVSKSIDIAKDWLERSARIPLSIQVYMSPSSEHAFDEHLFPELNADFIEGVTSLSKIINASSTRWEALDLRIPPTLFSMFHGEPSNLRELRVENYLQHREPDACLLSAEGANKPTPTYVAFDFVRFKALDISWSNVTCTDTKGIDLQECVELLREAPQLVQCSFGMIKPPRNPWVGSRHVVHQGLKDLKILLPVFGALDDDCLDHLTLPSLQHLTVQLYASPLPVQNILSLIERSSCTLGSLDIGAVFVEEELVEMLKKIPSLFYLSLKPCLSDDTFSAEGFFRLLAQTTELFYEEVEDEGENENENENENKRENHNQNESSNDIGHDSDNNVLSSPQNSGGGVQEQSNSETLHDEDDEEIFLPELECLKYDQFRPEECSRIWDLIPAAFGYPMRKEVDLDSPDLRPLRSMMVSLEPPVLMRDAQLLAPQYISESTLGQVQELIDLGCEIEVLVSLRQRTEPEDFIARSVAWHAQEHRGD